jgi:hypothetical protein
MMLSGSTTLVFQLAESTCRINSRQRQQGGKTLPSSQTATMATIRVRPAFNISAMAACSAQNPMPHVASMQIPVNTAPESARTAAPTPPATQSSEHAKHLDTSRAATTNFSASKSVIAIPPRVCLRGTAQLSHF